MRVSRFHLADLFVVAEPLPPGQEGLTPGGPALQHQRALGADAPSSCGGIPIFPGKKKKKNTLMRREKLCLHPPPVEC